MFGKKAAKQQPATGMTKGTIAGCPCPWCGTKQDLRDLDYAGVKDQITCESCNRHYEIVQTKPVTLVWLRRFVGTPRIG